MTNGQMISTLKGLTFGTVVGSKGVEALDMAIKVLKDEPSNPSEQLSIQYSKGYQDGFLAAKELFEEKGEEK